jgi:hypothetical protein
MLKKVQKGVVSLAVLGAVAADPATLSHGPGETLLTGSTADKVKQAASTRFREQR